MKGLSLPINTIVIILIAFLVLLVVAALFSGMFSDTEIKMKRQSAINQACQELRSLYGCDKAKMSSVTVKHQDIGDKSPKDYSLARLCDLMGYDEDKCYKTCGCTES